MATSPGASAQDLPELSVVIGSHNARTSVAACLGALQKQRNGCRAEIIVVDNSTDGTAAIVAAQFLTGDLLLRPFARWPPASAQFPGAPSFQVWQLLTYGFLHGSLTHLFFNMFALYMFGGEIERLLGTQRYVTYYLVCVVGAAVAQLLVISNMNMAPIPTAVSYTHLTLPTIYSV